jgi:hypothetical protein
VAARIRYVAVRRWRVHALRIPVIRRTLFSDEHSANGVSGATAARPEYRRALRARRIRAGSEAASGRRRVRIAVHQLRLEPRRPLRCDLRDRSEHIAAFFSLGTGFRAPLLFERYRFPYDQLPLDANNVFIGQGSPNEHPEHATEYELGASHEFSSRATLDVSFYQTNLRDPIEIFYPFAAATLAGANGKPLCAANSYQNPIPACVSFNSNVGNAVYQGAEVRFTQRLAPHLLATARYGLNIAYPKDLNAQFSNPTSGGSLVDNEQFLGIPQQQGSLELEYDGSSWHAAGSGTARGNDNELNQGPFAIFNALVGRHFGSGIDLSLSGTNLTNAVAGAFTRLGAGEPYRGVGGLNASGADTYTGFPTNAEFVEPTAVRLILTLRR